MINIMIIFQRAFLQLLGFEYWSRRVDYL